MTVVKIFIVVSIIGFFSCESKNPTKPCHPDDKNSLICEAENYSDSLGLIRTEEKPNASNKKCVHIGPDSNDENEGIGSALIYNFSLEADFSMGVFEVWYSDDVGGNIIHVYLDDNKYG